MTSVEGGMHTESLAVNGNLTVNGSLNAGDASVDGRLKCRGVATAADFDCDGMASLERAFSPARSMWTAF